jgi:Flp pilus assembly protein CpaB
MIHNLLLALFRAVGARIDKVTSAAGEVFPNPLLAIAHVCPRLGAGKLRKQHG